MHPGIAAAMTHVDHFREPRLERLNVPAATALLSLGVSSITADSRSTISSRPASVRLSNSVVSTRKTGTALRST